MASTIFHGELHCWRLGQIMRAPSYLASTRKDNPRYTFHLDVAHPPSHRASSRGYPPRRTVVIGRVAQPSDGKPRSGCPILRGFLRRVGGRLTAPWASSFTPRVRETKSSPNPHSPALAQPRREDRSDNCSSANQSSGVATRPRFTG